MMSKKNRTRQQMEEEMRQLRKVFMTVRLMKADEVQGGKKGSAPCYAQWRRSRPCENCVARQALEKNTRKTRLEYFGQELYEITASCVQVDGQLCVLELTRKIDRSVLLDPENGERLQCRCFAPARPGRSIRCCWTACGRSRTRSTMPCVVGRRPYKSDRRAARTGKALRFLLCPDVKTKVQSLPAGAGCVTL